MRIFSTPQFQNGPGLGPHHDGAVVKTGEDDAVLCRHTHRLADISRNGDLAFAGESGFRHGVSLQFGAW